MNTPTETMSKDVIKQILNAEIATQVWYQDRTCEVRLEKCLERAEKKLNNYIQSELSLSQNRILEEVEGMKKSEDKYSKRNNPQVLWSDVGYNQALKDIIKLISKKDN